MNAEEMVAGARRAFFVMLGLLAVIWSVQLANWAEDYRLSLQFGIVPRQAARLPDLLTAPFLHWSWAHLEANSGPLFIFGFLAAYRGALRFLSVSVVVVLVSGLTVWLFDSGNGATVGASGLVYGLFGYVVVRGLFDRHLLDVLIGMVMALSFAYILVSVVPGTPGVSWLGHLGGLAGGIVGGWLFRARRPAPAGAGAGSGAAPAVGTGAGAGAGAGAGSGAAPPVGTRADLHAKLDELGL